MYSLIKRFLDISNIQPVEYIPSDISKVQHEIKLFYTKNNKCDNAILVFLVDAILLVLSMVGLKVSNEERITRALIRDLGQETLNGIGRLIHEFNEANTAYKKSKYLLSILKILKDDGVFDDVKDIIKSEMTFKEWIFLGISAFAQLALWFGTDGVGFIAECVMVIMSAGQLIEDGIEVDKHCKNK